MMAIIVGDNRIEYCKIRKKDFNKRAFFHRDQLYVVNPDDLIKMRFYDEKNTELKRSEEVVIFNENSGYPYDAKNYQIYSQDNVLSFIDLIRNIKLQKKSKLGMLSSLRNGLDAFIPYIGVLFMAAILGYVFIQAIL